MKRLLTIAFTIGAAVAAAQTGKLPEGYWPEAKSAETAITSARSATRPDGRSMLRSRSTPTRWKR